MAKATLTRAAPTSASERRWRIVMLASFIVIFAAMIGFGSIQLNATLTNRDVGNDLRKIDCVTLHRIDPAITLHECEAAAQ